ncbi:MAG TPA: TRAP transporter fused permease subunit [Anaerovoracaceae bacterium]|nr:TRAP transporter fused permease subunit [Anaerovoracaceae bacterium]
MNEQNTKKNQNSIITRLKNASIRTWLVGIMSVSVCAFHLYMASIGTLTSYILVSVHWLLVGTIVILLKPHKMRGGVVIDAVLIGLTIFLSVYQINLQRYLTMHPGRYTNMDLVVSVIATVICLYLGVRVLGWMMSVLCVICILYGFYGYLAPGLFNTDQFSFFRIFTYMYTSPDGLFGSTLMVSAKFLLLFLFFGAVMEITGAGEIFVDLAYSIAGRVRGGPAQAAVFSSMLFGMVNGSGPANVATCGTFTIPLMKKVGYRNYVAGAIEAAGSSGGQIMPPVMGAAAFIMSEIIAVPYSEIAVAAFVPAVLYYLCLCSSVYGFARRDKMKKTDPSELPSFWKSLKGGWYILIPIATIIVTIFSGYSPQRAAFCAIVATFIVTAIFNRTRLTLDNLLKACLRAGKNCGPLALACMLAGIMMGMINLTGFGLKISTLLQMVAGGNLFITLFLAMLMALLLGLGLPTTAAYIILAVLINPALQQLGVDPLAANLFLLYFAALSSLTPPVALSAYTAASIADAPFWKTGNQSMLMAAAGFVVPFIFVYNNGLLLMGTPGGIAISIVTATIGCFVMGLIISGWCWIDLPMVTRILLTPCAFMIMVANPLWMCGLGIVCAVLILIVTRMFTGKGKPNLAAD